VIEMVASIVEHFGNAKRGDGDLLRHVHLSLAINVPQEFISRVFDTMGVLRHPAAKETDCCGDSSHAALRVVTAVAGFFAGAS
jgi:hypothetical protein